MAKSMPAGCRNCGRHAPHSFKQTQLDQKIPPIQSITMIQFKIQCGYFLAKFQRISLWVRRRLYRIMQANLPISIIRGRPLRSCWRSSYAHLAAKRIRILARKSPSNRSWKRQTSCPWFCIPPPQLRTMHLLVRYPSPIYLETPRSCKSLMHNSLRNHLPNSPIRS